MIASLRGRLRSKDVQGAVVDCHGVGYGVAMSATSLARVGGEGSDVELWVHTHVTQEAIRLFGFADLVERQTFELLIGITGVGPKLALAVLSAFSPEELAQLVANGDKAALVRVPGIGGKTADRLLLELRHRLPERLATAPAAASVPLAGDLASALANLGYKPGEAEAAARAVLEQHPDEQDLATLVRLALRAAARR